MSPGFNILKKHIFLKYRGGMYKNWPQSFFLIPNKFQIITCSDFNGIKLEEEKSVLIHLEIWKYTCTSYDKVEIIMETKNYLELDDNENTTY